MDNFSLMIVKKKFKHICSEFDFFFCRLIQVLMHFNFDLTDVFTQYGLTNQQPYKQKEKHNRQLTDFYSI